MGRSGAWEDAEKERDEAQARSAGLKAELEGERRVRQRVEQERNQALACSAGMRVEVKGARKVQELAERERDQALARAEASEQHVAKIKKAVAG